MTNTIYIALYNATNINETRITSLYLCLFTNKCKVFNKDFNWGKIGVREEFAIPHPLDTVSINEWKV